MYAAVTGFSFFCFSLFLSNVISLSLKYLHPLAVPKSCSEVITARDKSGSRGGVGDAANVVVVA